MFFENWKIKILLTFWIFRSKFLKFRVVTATSVSYSTNHRLLSGKIRNSFFRRRAQLSTGLAFRWIIIGKPRNLNSRSIVFWNGVLSAFWTTLAATYGGALYNKFFYYTVNRYLRRTVLVSSEWFANSWTNFTNILEKLFFQNFGTILVTFLRGKFF